MFIIADLHLTAVNSISSYNMLLFDIIRTPAVGSKKLLLFRLPTMRQNNSLSSKLLSSSSPSKFYYRCNSMAFLSLKILCANLNKMCPNIFCTFLRLNIVLLRSLILSTQIKPELTSEFYELFKNDFNEKSAILNPLSILIILCHQYFQPSPSLFLPTKK